GQCRLAGTQIAFEADNIPGTQSCGKLGSETGGRVIVGEEVLVLQNARLLRLGVGHLHPECARTGPRVKPEETARVTDRSSRPTSPEARLLRLPPLEGEGMRVGWSDKHRASGRPAQLRHGQKAELRYPPPRGEGGGRCSGRTIPPCRASVMLWWWCW